MNPTPHLPLDVREDPRGLATVEWVRRELGLDASSVVAKAERGELLWVFNVSTKPDGLIRRLLFWPLEVAILRIGDPGAIRSIRSMLLPSVLAKIIGTQKEHLRSAEVAQILLLSKPTVWGLWKTGALGGVMTANTLKISRTSLESFLSARLQH